MKRGYYLILFFSCSTFSLQCMQEQFKKFLKDARANANNPQTTYCIQYSKNMSTLLFFTEEHGGVIKRIDEDILEKLNNVNNYLPEFCDQWNETTPIANILTMSDLSKKPDFFIADFEKKKNIIRLKDQTHNEVTISIKDFQQLVQEGLSEK